jgi:hypothetical protein
MCTTMFKKGYDMNNKTMKPSTRSVQTADLTAAVEHFIAQGGVIDILRDNERSVSFPLPIDTQLEVEAAECNMLEKVKLLKALVDKGAGISALQYALRMNRKDIRKLALEHGVTIVSSRKMNRPHATRDHDAGDVDDGVAGHAMHYSSLGYTAQEIAGILGLSVRQIRDLAQAYRFELKQREGD